MHKLPKQKLIPCFFLFFILILAFFLRFSGLGYSHFYGDETKALYTRKDISATQFLLNQRKGPVQFVVAWTMEQVTGSFDEFYTRLPFALAGVLGVLAFYYILERLFGVNIALLGAFLMTINGFFIAFSRTVQYQSFLIFFGLLAFLAAHFFFAPPRLSAKLKFIKKEWYLFLSGLFLGFAFLSHWDAVFFAIPVMGIIFLALKNNTRAAIVKNLLWFVLPLVVVSAFFYLPYVLGGYFNDHTLNYMARRLSGAAQLPSSSLVTYYIYNPTKVYIILPLVLLVAAYSARKTLGGIGFKILVLWSVVPFVVFEVLFSNPGTHIYNYILPLLGLVSFGINIILSDTKVKFSKHDIYLKYIGFAGLFVFLFMSSALVYVPMFKHGYPWHPRFNMEHYKNSYQLFLYGFPYNRGWDQIKAYYEKEGMASHFDTNDNVTIGEYYLPLMPVKVFKDKEHYPDDYIYILDNQEFNNSEPVYLSDTYVIKHTDGKNFIIYDYKGPRPQPN